ncbi:MAG: PAS domain-containing protein, partial [Planctomycetota bacterium]
MTARTSTHERRPRTTVLWLINAVAWSGVVLGVEGAAAIGVVSLTAPVLSAMRLLLITLVICCVVVAMWRMRSLHRWRADDQPTTGRTTAELLALRSALEDHTLFSIADAKGRIVEVSEGFCRISGYSRDELLGQDHRVLNSGVHPRAFWREMWRTIRGGKPWRAEVCNRAKDGSLYWVDSTNIPQFDEVGEVKGYISLRFDITEAKRDQEELQHTRQLLEETAELAKIGGWELDLSTMTARWSDEVCRIHGVEPGHVPNLETAIEFYAPEYRDMVTRYVERGMATGEPWEFEAELITAKGERVWVCAQGTPVMGDDGKCKLLRGAFQEITDRVEAEREHAKLQERFERAIAGTSDGLFDYVLSSGEMWYSDQLKGLLGFEEKDFGELSQDAESFEALLHPDDRERVAAALNAAIRCDAVYDIEYRLAVKHRGYRWFRARAGVIRDASGDAVQVSGAIGDIHEWRTAQSRLDLATRVSRLGLWDWDLETDEVYFSETFFTMLGYEPGEMPMCLQTWVDLVHPDDLAEALAALDDHRAGNTW